ncbi:hypothetical protein [Flavobacterium collinsii]|uniref:Uncharacterized protein n=1 Tax=Flavobacterium collinsii TaxID=1114861 RepID=A0A9W4TI57_9FLAO|nr:hypothetical protein [Flavobacterium collinsii]CAI2768687.1 conserved membrane protein of unknown function [Flavobacterium collinsii]
MDNNNINFNELWAEQATSAPNLKDLVSKANLVRHSNLRKLIFKNIIFTLVAAFLIFIWVNFHPQLLSTKIGIVLIVLAMAVYIFSSSQNIIQLLNKINTAQSNKDYLNHLLALKEKQQFLQTKISNLYFVLFSSGICLYFYENALKMPVNKAVYTYLAIVAFIIWGRFYMKPRLIKKQQVKLDEIIRKFENINKQLD